jgi:hypothetical protein
MPNCASTQLNVNRNITSSTELTEFTKDKRYGVSQLSSPRHVTHATHVTQVLLTTSKGGFIATRPDPT